MFLFGFVPTAGPTQVRRLCQEARWIRKIRPLSSLPFVLQHLLDCCVATRPADLSARAAHSIPQRREAHEETLLPPSPSHPLIHTLPSLPPFLSKYGLVVHASLVFVADPAIIDALVASPAEVDYVWEAPLEMFLDLGYWKKALESEGGLEGGKLAEKGSPDWLYEEDVYSTTDTAWRVSQSPSLLCESTRGPSSWTTASLQDMSRRLTRRDGSSLFCHSRRLFLRTTPSIGCIASAPLIHPLRASHPISLSVSA